MRGATARREKWDSPLKPAPHARPAQQASQDQVERPAMSPAKNVRLGQQSIHTHQQQKRRPAQSANQNVAAHCCSSLRVILRPRWRLPCGPFCGLPGGMPCEYCRRRTISHTPSPISTSWPAKVEHSATRTNRTAPAETTRPERSESWRQPAPCAANASAEWAESAEWAGSAESPGPPYGD